MPEVCAAGPGGLFLLRFGRWDPAFSFATEDAMPASLQCLWADEAGVWAGGAGGLALWDGERWDARNEPGDPALRDVRSLAAPAEWRSDQLLWAAEWPGGLRRISLGFYVPRRLLNLPLAALAPLPDGRMWAASSDQLYLVDAPPGLACAEQPVLTLAPPTMIHTLCTDGELLWIGSSLGLGRISASDVHYAPVAALEGKPVLALARHPQRGEVWAGGPGGLYAPPDYQRLEGSGQVLALAFSAQGKLWVGTPHGLESWSVDEQRRVAKYDPHRHGLAAGRVACLVVRQTPRGDEIWVGTPAGVSCFTVGG
jgi:ligand-binding sensor domain-containing protein